MKFAVLSFGAAGFFIVALTGLASGRAPDLVLRDGALACLLTAWVGRWFWRNLETAFAQTLDARRAAAQAAEEAEAAAAQAPTPAPAAKSAAPRPSTVPAAAPAPATARR